jgi:hypothetical protein
MITCISNIITLVFLYKILETILLYNLKVYLCLDNNYDPLIFPTNLIVHAIKWGRDQMVVGFTTIYTLQSVSITTDIVSSNLDQGEVYNIM